MTARALKIYGAAVTLAVASMSAQAVNTYCSAAGPHPQGLDVSDVNYSVTGASPFTNSTDCYGVVGDTADEDGNVNSASDVNGVWGTGWVYADATDGSSGTATLFGGSFTFTLSGPANGATSGVYTLTATDNNGGAPPNFPIGLDFIVALKASDRYALYFFDNAVFDGSGGGSWSIQFVNNGGQIPGLSHLTVFVKEGDTVISSTSTSTGSTSSSGVPEPASSGLALLGLGLLGASFWARRRKA